MKSLNFKFSEAQAKQLIEHQTQANDVMAGDWVHTDSKQLAYYRAAYIELSEALMEIGYKWWKKEEPDTKKVLFELVDALHFVISDHIRYFTKKHRDSDRAASFLMNSFINIYEPAVEHIGVYANKVSSIQTSDLSLQDLCDQAIYSTIKEGRASINWLAVLFERLGISNNQVVYYYLAKNTLNKFRDANGQKEGTYIRKWNDKDDNTYLYAFVDSAIENQTDINVDDIWNYLETSYETVKN